MYVKINMFANNLATTYAGDINNVSILMFSSMRKQILSFVFTKKYCKVYMYANISKNNRISQWNCDGYRSGTATNIFFWLIVVFCLDYAWLIPLL